MSEPFTLEQFWRWSRACADALGAAREEMDALNVFPVPDGDTGTNLYLTWEAAGAAAKDRDDVESAVRAFVDGALLGARGNSGVILSQLLRASVPALVGSGRPVTGSSLAASFEVAATAAYAAVGRPVEGTILTVARRASSAAVEAAAIHDGVAAVVTAAAAAAREAVERTPDQLDQLRQAGVVDAGGRGLSVVLDATERVLTGRWDESPPVVRGRHIPVPNLEGGGLRPDGPAYEVMYLLDAADTALPALRTTLDRLGDSLVVVGGDGLWNVHVHVDDVGAALEAGLVAGRPHRIAVQHFAEQMGRAALAHERIGRAVLISAVGAGLEELFTAAGGHVLGGEIGERHTTTDFLAAIVRTAAAEVVVLPNDIDAVSVAEAAAREARTQGIRVAVVPTVAQVQGLAALAVHEPGRGFDDDVVAMTAAASHTRHGGVTVATGAAMTMAGPCEPGDVLGAVGGDFVLIGADLVEVSCQVLSRLMSGGGELCTLVLGGEVPSDLADRLEAYVRTNRPEIDTLVYAGGQDRYPLLVAVE